MAGTKISALPSIPSSALSDIAPFVQGGVTYQATNSQLVTLFNTSITLSGVAQVTGLPASLVSLLPLAGGTMTGVINMGSNKITNLTNPTSPQDAATKSYVDTFATGLTVILSCAAATTANLNATSAGAGIGATLTNAGAMAAFAVDGYSASLNDRILVKNQTVSQHNGIYSVTTVGSGAANWVLTRTTDYDTAAQIKPGTLVAVNNGTANANTSWLETATVVTVDTDPVSFSQFTFSSSSFFLIANNLSEGNPATMRTNLGLGTVAVKAASDASKSNAAMVNGATTIGHVATFSDINGTIQDGGLVAGTVTSIATSGLATGGPITSTGTITVTAASSGDQHAATSNTVAVTPSNQQFHDSAIKAWFQGTISGNVLTVNSSYNVSSVTRNSAGDYTVNFTNAFAAANYGMFGSVSNGSGGGGQFANFVIKKTGGTYTPNAFELLLENLGGTVGDPNFVSVAFFGRT